MQVIDERMFGGYRPVPAVFARSDYCLRISNMNTSKQKQQTRRARDNDNCIERGGDDSQASRESCESSESGEAVARVTAVDRDQYLVRNEHSEVPAELTGRFVYTREWRSDLPCVGDWVRVRYRDGGSHASIHDILPRQSFLRRKSPGKNVEFQMIAANIDVAFIVQSCHYDFNVRRLERYLVMVNEGHIEPVILLTKTDLVSADELEQRVGEIHRAGIGARVIALSNVTGDGVDQIRELMQAGKTYCLLGSSGVGKTTLINRLVGDSGLETGAVSHTGEGRHTTTRRQLVALENGGFLIDMPGMRELGLLGVGEGGDRGDDGAGDVFADVREYAKSCRFADCTHASEPGCAVRQAIAQGEIDADHFRSYLKLRKESEFHDLSYHEKRKKDRAFGQLVGSVLKAKEKRKFR
jgi:ribosome biogenesis GTPase